jgi:hypothetical protein
MTRDQDLVTVAPDVAASMAAHAATVKASQAKTRATSRPTTSDTKKAHPSSRKATTGPSVATPDTRTAALVAWRKTAVAPPEVLAVVDTAILRGTATPRATGAKAEPSVVAAFFASTGLTRKQIADAVGVSTSVIGTVQKESGDRWSMARFELAKPLILAAAKKAATAKPSEHA